MGRLRSLGATRGVAGLDERSWQGGRLLIYDAVIGIHDLRSRCNMTAFDPDTLVYDPNVLRDIVKRFGGKLGLNCDVVSGGDIQVGQPVEFVRRQRKTGAGQLHSSVAASGKFATYISAGEYTATVHR
jgi:MOSC domain-containing protein YiiM